MLISPTDSPLRRAQGLRPRVPAGARGLSNWGRGALASALAAVVFAGCRPTVDAGASASGGDGTEAAQPGFDGLERSRSVKVLTAPAEMREMVRTISTTVNAESEREIDIFPRTSGVAVKVVAEEGMRVREGEVLLELDPRESAAALKEADIALKEAVDSKNELNLAVTEAVQRVERARLTYEQSRRELERKEGAGAGLLSKNELEQLSLTVETNLADLSAQKVSKERAEAALSSQAIAAEKAELQIERAQLNLSFMSVTAPFDGVIARRNVRVGDLVSSAEAAFVLTDPDNVRAVVSRPQREFGFFRTAELRSREASAGDAENPSLDIEIEPEALPGEVYGGRILFVSPTIDAASGQFRVTLAVDQPKDQRARPPVLPGMLLRVRIVTERHPDALVVPKRALLREGESYFVIVAEDGIARRIRVEEGFTTDDDVEVTPTVQGDLMAGASVIVVGNRDLDDGDRVEATPWRPQPGAAAPEVDSPAEEMAAEQATPDQGMAAEPEIDEGTDEGTAEAEAETVDPKGGDKGAGPGAGPGTGPGAGPGAGPGTGAEDGR